MQTTTIDYKTVFELAKEKGYGLFDPIRRSDYVELCLLQKWLRDAHRIMVSIHFWIFSQAFEYSIADKDRNRENGIHYPTYEFALMKGINEALKLI